MGSHIAPGLNSYAGDRDGDIHGLNNITQGHAEPADTNAATLLAAASAGQRNYVRQLVVFPKALATAAYNIYTIKSGSTTLFIGTVLNPATAPATSSNTDSISFDPPLQGGVAEAITVTLGVASTANFFARGFTGV